MFVLGRCMVSSVSKDALPRKKFAKEELTGSNILQSIRSNVVRRLCLIELNIGKWRT